jgi:hypothetical protein
MSQYITSPFKPSPVLLVSGTNQYLYGSWNSNTGPTQGSIISDSAVTTTATVTFRILSGNVPVTGALITVVGASRSANLNVTNATILTVSAAANPDAGVYTVTYAITSTSLAVGFDGGQVIIPQPEIGETLVNGSSAPVAMPFQNAQMNQGKALVVVVSFPTVPTAAVITLQSALFDIDSEYANVATVVSVAGGVVTGGQVIVDDQADRFYRLNTSGLTGSGTIVGKING